MNKDCLKIYNNIKRNIKGKDEHIKLLITGFISGLHILLEDYPGVGKTSLAKSLAQSIDIPFNRIQCTPDLMPSDILGISIFDNINKNFNFHKGPIFTNILLADELNRANPKTQSALLEAMQEKQVSIDSNKYLLDKLFFVIATQNPIDNISTYKLPQAQLDRFALKFSLGYPEFKDELSILDKEEKNNKLESVVTKENIVNLKMDLDKIFINDDLKKYILEIVRSTRIHKAIDLGASPRAAIHLLRLSKAFALIENSDYVKPDYIYYLTPFVISHRIILNNDAKFSGLLEKNIVKNILEQTKIPKH